MAAFAAVFRIPMRSTKHMNPTASPLTVEHSPPWSPSTNQESGGNPPPFSTTTDSRTLVNQGSVRQPLEVFLPRSGSVFVFILGVACYDWALSALFGAFVRLLHFPPRPYTFWELHGDPIAHVIEALAFAPLLESCVLVALIGLLRWLRAPTVVQVLFAAATMAIPHSYSWHWEPYAFVIAPSFAIQAASYTYWRGASRMRAFGVVVALHALHNLLPTMISIANASGRS